MAEPTEQRAGGSTPPAKPSPLQSPLVRGIALVALIVLVIGGVLLYLHSRQFEDTDDAEIDGHINPISARIAGTVAHVNPALEDNHPVAAGMLLVEIDPTDYATEVSRTHADLERLEQSAAASGAEVQVVTANANGQVKVAQAMLDAARQAVGTERANREAARARLAQAVATFKTADDDWRRYGTLLAKQEISRSEYDQRETAAHNAGAAVDGAKAEVGAAAERVAQAESRVAQQQAELQRAQTAGAQITQVQRRAGSARADSERAAAQVHAAELNLSYTKIEAPVSGVIGRRSVEVGQRVQPGQELFTIVQTGDVWVTANFKETQLRLMHPGQEATIHVDTYDRDLKGHVESVGAATGARFSLLPPENATGNFVKVVQRLPVRIRLDVAPEASAPLRPGMSVNVEVKVR